MAGTATERWSPRSAMKGPNGSQGRVREFDVINIDPGDEAAVFAAVLSSTDYPNPTGLVPVIDEPHPLNSLLKVRDLSITWPGMTYARLKATYATPQAGSFGSDEEDPVDRPTRWRWVRSEITEPVDRDIDGNPLVNSAGDPFVGVTRRMVERVLEATRYEYFYDESLATAIENTVSSAVWSITGVLNAAAAGTVRCFVVTPADEYEADAPYVKILYRFGIRIEGWRTRNLDQGAWGLGPDGKRYRIVDALGDPVTSALLDGSGKPVDTTLKLGNASGTITPTAGALPAGATLEVNGGATAGYLRYLLDGEIDYNTLAL